MSRSKLALLVAVAFLISTVFMLFQGAHRPAQAATGPAAPTPGQLAIVGKDGDTVALCPLKHTDVTADISGFVSRVTVKQQFQNPSTTPIEAVYTFPLPQDAAVDDMTMIIGDRIIKGEIKRKEEARAIYEAARNAGQSAALLDQERSNIFTQSIANIMPGEGVTISISYVNMLKYDEGKYEFVFPMVVGPRYIPGGGGYTTPGKRGEPSPPVPANPGDTPTVTDASKITPPVTPEGTRAGHDISLTVNLDAGVPLQDITSVLHEVDVQRKGSTQATIRLKNQKTIPNKDFILRYTVGGQGIQSGLLAYSPGSGTGFFTLILQPPAAPPPSEVSPKEMIFVIDQTGSQSGWPIAKAKETMKYCMAHLNPGDTFQLLGFNTELFPCFPKPVPATPENIATAQKFLEPIEGNGGTDILKSVEYALKLPTDPARPRIVCYMTDGYVGNDMQILDCVQKNRGSARMFPFGVGNSVNRLLIDGMAREGRGAAEYVTLDESGEAAAEKFYKRVAQPLLLDVKVAWNGLPVEEVYPHYIPDVFSAGPIILKGRYNKAAEGDIVVSGLLHGKPWSETVHVRLPAYQPQGSSLQSLWARDKIEDLQAQDWMGAQTGQPNAKIKDEIVNVALENRLMSQWTSFVAVEQKVVNIGGKMKTVDVPVEMPDGVSYEGIFGAGERRVGVYGARHGISKSAMVPLAEIMAQGASASQQYGQIAGAAPGGSGGVSGVITAPAGGAGGDGGGIGGYGGPAAVPTLVPPAMAAAGPAGGATGGTYTWYGADPDGSLLDAPVMSDGKVWTSDEVRDVIHGTPAGEKRLDALKPEERQKALEILKIAPALRGLADTLKKDGKDGTLHKPGGPDVDKGQVEVQIWLNELPADGLAKLKALGFNLVATLQPGKLLLGTLPVEKLDELVALPFVMRVEPPKFK